MARALIIGGIVAAIFWVYSVVDCAVQPPTRHRGVSKGAWLAIVILIPVLGGILWFIIGRARFGGREAPRVLAPDDDPEFLASLRRAESDARIALLEAELARLDEEDDDGGPEASR